MPENATSRARGAKSISAPCTATIASAAKRLASALDTANASAEITNDPVLNMPSIVSVASGASATCVPATNNPAKSSSAASFAPKIVGRDSGSAIRIRKSN